MKKLMALFMTLVMALSCFGAFAEDTATVVPSTEEITLQVNGDLLTALLGGSMTEEDQQMMALLLPVLNNLGARAVTAADGSQVEVTLKGAPVATLSLAAAENGAVLTSDLFPSYALTIPAETLNQFSAFGTSAMEGTEFEMDTLMTALAPYAGEVEMGEFTFEGVAFNAKQPYQMTSAEFAKLVIGLVKARAEEDPSFASMLSSILAQQGMTLADLDTLPASLDESGEETTELVNLALYLTMDAQGQPGDDLYFTFDVTTEEEVTALSIGMVQGKAYLHLVIGEAIYTSMDEMRQAAAAGSGEVMVMDAIIEQPGETEVATQVSLLMQGMYLGATSTLAPTETGLAATVDVYFMTDQAPMISLAMTQTPGGELTVPVNTEGKTVVSLNELAADEEGTVMGGLMMDVMSYGLNNLIANAAITMPDEINALVTLLSAPAEDAAATPVEGVTE